MHTNAGEPTDGVSSQRDASALSFRLKSSTQAIIIHQCASMHRGVGGVAIGIFSTPNIVLQNCPIAPSIILLQVFQTILE